ncbi:MAG: Dabb family protein [Tannerella sp.]|jgi:hypothetical protein|nr:Dabb family protein [Tannerella sp.]
MVKHIVLSKLIDQQDRQRAVDALLDMRGKIEGLLDVEAGYDFLASGRSYDVAVICTLKDRAALDFFRDHPIHLPVVKLMNDIRESSVTVDYEY